jgi:HEPN domain-containing protein
MGYVDGFASAEQCRERFRRGLEGLHMECKHAGLSSICTHVEVVQRQLVNSTSPAPEMIGQVSTLMGVLQKTLTDTLLYRLDEESKSLLREWDGEMSSDGASAFPSGWRELSHAARCLAFGESTACVFHSMRAIEFGIKGLVTALSIAPSSPNWENILNDCDKAIKQIDPKHGTDWKEVKQFYSEAAVNFRYFKDAWRNHTMHGTVSFGSYDAKQIMMHSRSLLEHLSSRLREES